MVTMYHPDQPGRTLTCSRRQAAVHAMSGWVEATPPETIPLTPDVDDELDDLRTTAEAAGVKVDKRWGEDRLTREIQAATEASESD